jgi:hypothetical protein
MNMKEEKESYCSLEKLKEPTSLAFWTKVSDRIGHGTNGTNECTLIAPSVHTIANGANGVRHWRHLNGDI